jgi:mannose-binding lectin 2
VTAPETNIAIPSVAYLGFSAETGELSDNHDIISVKAQNLYNVAGGGKTAPPRQAERPRPKPRKESGGWSWFFIKVFIFIVVVVGGYAGWVAYRSRTRYSRF